MTIKRPVIGALHKNQGESLSFCPDCDKGGIKQKMEERIYLPNEFGKTVIPADANLWRQCHRCGLILPIYNLKKEGRLVSELVVQQNPFDKGKTVGISNNRIGKTRKGKEREEDYYNDPDLKQELKEGGQLISYSES